MMNKRDIDTIVFDIGNVLITFDPLGYLRESFNDEDMLNLVCNAIFRSKEWLELDRGTLDEEAFGEIISHRIPEHKRHVTKVMEGWEEILNPIESSIALLPGLKEKGYKLYLLSNFHKKAFKKVYEKYEFFQYFDGRLISSDYQLLKPEKAIYQKLIELYNLNPSTTLFIDDAKENIEVAKKLGFQTIHFKEAQQINDFLTK